MEPENLPKPPRDDDDEPMRKYSETSPPPASLYWRNAWRGIQAGLTPDTARKYATLTWWGEHLGIRTPAIVSGRRSYAHQMAMRARWDRGDRAGLVARPAKDSLHVKGEAFDLQNTGALHILGRIAEKAGLLWGGTFRDPDPVHFQVR
jgi:hypothetical protein